MAFLAAAAKRARTVAVALVSSCLVAALLDAWLLALCAEGQTYIEEARNLTGAFCKQLYSCDPELRRARPPNLPAACSCHDYCRVAGDCCADKTPPASLSPTPPADSYQCISHSSFAYPVRMVTVCPSLAVDAQVVNFCAIPISDESQPDFLMTPVTDRVSGLTYRNIYCAHCWGIADQRISSWLWQFVCNSDHFDTYSGDVFMPVKLAKADTTPSTAAPTTTTTTMTTIAPELDLVNTSSVPLRLRDLCSLSYAPPTELTSVTHNCTAGVYDTCFDNMTDEYSQSECASGAVAMVYDSTRAYKNAACAACSSRATSSASLACIPRVSSSIVQDYFDILLSPSSGCCAAVHGWLPQSHAWPFPWLCQGQNRCPSVDSKPDNAAAAMPNDVASIATLEDYRRRMNRNTTSSCTSERTLDNYARSVNVTYATFANDTLVLVINETDALCVQCAIRRCTNFTATNRSLDCAADGQLYHYEYPLFVVEGDVAVACGLSWTTSSDAVVENGIGCPAIPEVVSVVSLCLSEVCLVVFFAVFALIKDQRRFPQEFIFNQSVAFFLAFLLFLLRPVASDSQCKALAATIHYFLLCAFAWTALYAVQITRVLSSVPLRSSRNPFRWRLVSYVLGWISPLVCVSLGLAADAEHLDFKPDYGPPQCFISNPLGSVTLFLAPMGTFLLVDVVAYCYIIVRLIQVARQTAFVRKSHNEKLFLCIKLVLCLGLLWISGIVAVFTGSQVAYCIFTLFNSWQGVFTFSIFVCKRDTLVSIRRGAANHEPVHSFNGSSVATNSFIINAHSIVTGL